MQEDFAKILDVHKNTLVRFESEKGKPNIEELNRILTAFPDINPTWLLTGEGEMKRGSAISEGVGPELDLALMEKIVFETIKGGRMTGDEAQDLLITGMARMTAAAVVNQYRDSVGLPSRSVDQVISSYNSLLSSLNEQLNAIADKRGV